MVRSIDETRDASAFDTRPGDATDTPEPPSAPRLRVLYHVDLGRIGGFSHPELALESGRWQTVGRAHPLFITAASGAVWRPLEDPTLSREQLRIRWLDEAACFEVEPVASSRRRLFLCDPLDPSARAPIVRPTRVRPGACVGVDDRLVLGLELLSRHHGPEEDRLGLVGEDAAIWQLRREILELGAFRKPVFILGETGTGKELVARAIHRHGGRPDGPLQTLNCAAIPEQLVESLLFGHAKGAFTGATTAQDGVFRAADGGTLFLDELGEMPVLVQPKLLRALQDGLVTAVGQQRSVKVDVRLVAATHRDPEREVAEGRLRADLYHRIAAHVVHVPRLAARRFDIPGLFMHFLARCGEDHPALDRLWRGAERWRVTVPLEFFVDMMAGEWPGNVRQLENMAERTARLNLEDRSFSRPELPGRPPVPAPATAPAAAVGDPSVAPREPTPDGQVEARRRTASRLLGIAPKTIGRLLDAEALAGAWSGDADEAALTARLERAAGERLHALLRAHSFAQARVAEQLGLAPWTLIRLMQRLDISRPAELSREQIARALAEADGDLGGAARILEISEHGLKKRLAALSRST
jgi:two-component system nitrogen regulation response regulator GlnG